MATALKLTEEQTTLLLSTLKVTATDAEEASRETEDPEQERAECDLSESLLRLHADIQGQIDPERQAETAYVVLYTDFEIETPGGSGVVGVLTSKDAAEEHVARCYVEQAATWLHDEEEDLKAAEEDGDEVDAPLSFYTHLAESVKDDIAGYSIDTAPLYT